MISGLIYECMPLLLAGAVMLTACDASTINGLFLMLVLVQAIYGIGKYPVVRPDPGSAPVLLVSY